MLATLVQAYRPDPQGLMDQLRAQLTLSDLERISQADYGQDAHEHLAALTTIWRTGHVPTSLTWCPHEVLALTRWSTPEPEDHTGQLSRAFCCATLLMSHVRAPHLDALHMGGANQTLVALIESARCLGARALELTARWLTYALWCHDARTGRLVELDERPFYAYGLLLCAALDPERRLSAQALDALGWWVVDLEQRERQLMQGWAPTQDPSWLLGLTYFDLRHDLWRALTLQMARAWPEHPTLELIAGLTLDA